MTRGLVARRYATVLYDLVAPTGAADRVLSELGALHDLVEHHGELRQVLAAPGLAAARKRALVDALAARLEVSAPVRRLLELLAERDRLDRLGEIATAFADRVMQARRIVPAEVTTATPLGDAGRTSLARALGQAAGCEVTLKERVDPTIIGGMVAQVGSLVFDASLTRQLERMRTRLLAEA